MPKFTVEFKGVAFATDTVEVEDEADALEAAFPNGFPTLCAHCSGYGQAWTLEITEDPGAWDVAGGGVRAVEG
jgi:hypothetical protein